jgi:hypothetical protein
MGVNEIKATKKIGDVDKESMITYDFGGDLDGAIAKFGKEVVYANFVRSSVITAQAAMRRYMEDGKAQDEIISKMSAWKPGVPLERTVDPIAATLARFQSMSAEDQLELLNKLKSMKTK